jgi:hypothetical protein
MIYVTLDTCVWLKLLYIDFKNEDNYLEEICFWIENNHIIHIVPTNIIDEWNRHKDSYLKEIVKYFEKKEQDSIHPFKHNRELASTYKVEEVQKNVQKRIEKIDKIFSIHSEKADYNDGILKDAGLRSLHVVAPNHKKDSFRDTVNILSLIQHLKTKDNTQSIFITDNYKDFCTDNANRYELNDGLKTEFASVNLTYEYIGEKDAFGTKLFGFLRKELTANLFQSYLKDKKDKEEISTLTAKKSFVSTIGVNPDVDYLQNIKYIDMILGRKIPTAFEKELIKTLIVRHESYRQYFLTNIGNNGLV